MLRADHLDGASILVELKEPLLGHAACLDQRRVQNKGILGRREKEPVEVFAPRAVKSRAGNVMRIAGVRNTREGRGNDGDIDPAEVHDDPIEGRQYLR